VLLFTASGTGSFESAVANLVSPGDKVLAVSHGEFGERWAKLAAVYGADVQQLVFSWGEVPRADQLARALEETPADIVLLVHSETSTGVVADIEALAAVAKAAGALVVVDAVSSLGAVPLETDTWGLDVVVSGSQKALMSPPGLAFASVSPAAWERSEQVTSPRFYFDWRLYRKSFESLGTPFTPAVATVTGLDVALGMILDAGLETAFARHAALGRACREGAKGMGLELFSPDDESSAVVTAILAPDGANAKELVLALRDRFGITVAGGHGDMATRLFRIGHIGWFDVFDITTALAAVELILADMGAPITRGVAVTRALEAYAEAVAVR
jgi:aspartate aminotransferase-like enzyme